MPISRLRHGLARLVRPRRPAPSAGAAGLGSLDVELAYRYHFGRPPENEAVVQHHMTAHAHDPAELRRALLESPEWSGVARNVTAANDAFCVWRPGQPKIIVLGNCQGPGIGRAIASLADFSVLGLDILNVSLDQPALLRLLAGADRLLAPVLSERFGPLHSERVRDHFGGRVRLYSLPYFRGIHPDTVYLGEWGNRIQSPLGDYHSAVVVRSFLDGLSSRECVDRFSAGLTRLNPKAAFRRSAEELRRREAAVDIRIADWLLATIRRKPCLYTINHPTSDLFVGIAETFLAELGHRPTKTPGALLGNVLAGGVIWPVHAVIAQALGLRYATGDVFQSGSTILDLDEYVTRAYQLYDPIERGALQAAFAARS